MDNITPQEFAKQMGAYPNAPYNPTPVGGYMDEGFNWVMGAESFDAETEYKLCDGCEEMRSIRDFSYSNDPQQTLTESEVCDYCFGDLIELTMQNHLMLKKNVRCLIIKVKNVVKGYIQVGFHHEPLLAEKHEV